MTNYIDLVLPLGGLIVLIMMLVWTMVWTAIALWKSARNNQIIWFIVLLLLNTMGIIEILYLAFFQRNKNKAMPVIVQTVPKKKVAKKKAPARKKVKKKK